MPFNFGDVMQMENHFPIPKTNQVCPHCNTTQPLDSYRAGKLYLYDIETKSNVGGLVSTCLGCGKSLVYFIHNGSENFFVVEDVECFLFSNVSYCTKKKNEQADLARNIFCEITKKPIYFGRQGYSRNGITKEQHARMAKLMNYNEESAGVQEVHIISNAGLEKIPQCSFCGTNTFKNPKATFFQYYDADNDKARCCSDCKRRINDRFFGYNFRLLKGGKKNINPFDRMVGIELETVDGQPFGYFQLPKELQGNLRCMQDGSLHSSNEVGEEDEPNSPVNNDGYQQDNDDRSGREFCTVPLARDNLFSFIDNATEFLKSKGCTTNRSCGFHCHFDMKKENYHTVRKTFLVFSLFENQLFDMLPPTRRKSRFCLPLKKNYKQFFGATGRNEQQQFEHYWFNTTNDSYISTNKKHKYDPTRYVSINYHSLFFHGTLENRMHSGTLNATKIKNWILLNHILIEYAKSTPMKRILKLKGDKETFLNIVRHYEGLYPSLRMANLPMYINARALLFAQRDSTSLRVLNEVQPNIIEEEYINNYTQELFTKE
jgi:hypothetical protein